MYNKTNVFVVVTVSKSFVYLKIWYCKAVVESFEKIKDLEISENNLKSWVQFSIISLFSLKKL